MAGHFVFAETKRFSFISVLFQFCGQIYKQTVVRSVENCIVCYKNEANALGFLTVLCHFNNTRGLKNVTVPILSRYPYTWESPWEFPYPHDSPEYYSL